MPDGEVRSLSHLVDDSHTAWFSLMQVDREVLNKERSRDLHYWSTPQYVRKASHEEANALRRAGPVDGRGATHLLLVTTAGLLQALNGYLWMPGDVPQMIGPERFTPLVFQCQSILSVFFVVIVYVSSYLRVSGGII